MSESRLERSRPYLTALVVLAEAGHLAWEHFNGGVVSHNILNRPDLPAISNWWGLFLLPALTWFLLGRVQRRIALQSEGKEPRFPVSVVIGFLGALLLGGLLATSFANGYGEVTSYLFRGLLLLALVLPVYRAECVFGFILGMTFTFGAILPTAVASVIAAASAFVHLIVLTGIVGLWNWIRRTRESANA